MTARHAANSTVCFALLLITAVLTFSRSAAAVPPFARRYQVACNTCHTVPPQLNAFGEAFRMNGYQWPEEGDENGKIKDHPVILSADANREAFPDAFLPSDIPHLPAVGFQAKFTSLYNLPNPDGNVTFNGASIGQPAPQGNPYNKYGQLDWSGINEAFNIFFAGRITKNVSLFGGVGFYSPAMNFAIERAMIYWSNVFGPNWFNIKIGRFDPDVSFFSGFRKLVNDNYSIMSRTIGQPSGWSLEPTVQQPGIEVNGKIAGRVRYNIAALTNYTGLPGSLGGNGAGIQNDSLDTCRRRSAACASTEYSPRKSTASRSPGSTTRCGSASTASGASTTSTSTRPTVASGLPGSCTISETSFTASARTRRRRSAACGSSAVLPTSTTS